MNIKKTVRDILLAVIPTFFYPLLRRIVTSPFALYLEKHTVFSFFKPTWNTISSGPFKGISIYFDATSNFWSHEASGGMHDKDIFDFILKKNLKGKIIFDVGAHIGFNTLCFSKLIGEKGKVIAFEPNRFNRDRMDMNLERNSELAKRIVVSPVALSNKNGTDTFVFSNAIEDGTSSGSMIESVENKSIKEVYKRFGYEKTRVKTMTIDSYVAKTGYKPNLIKIDVEGAESLVLEGATATLRRHRPILLIELHTILNGYSATRILAEHAYTFQTLRVENDGRTFIAAIPQK